MKLLTELEDTWVLREDIKDIKDKYEKNQDAGKYEECLRPPIAEFNDLIAFWQLWNTLPYNDPGNCFTIEDDSSKALMVAQ